MQLGSEYPQQWGVEIEKLVRKAYLSSPSLVDSMLVQAFIDGIRDREVRTTVSLGHHKTLKDALAHALEVEAVRRDYRTYRVREVTDKAKPRSRIMCYMCGEIGHMRFSCPKKETRENEEIQRSTNTFRAADMVTDAAAETRQGNE